MNTATRIAPRATRWAAVLLAGAALAGCYVVPIQPLTPLPPATPTPAAVAPAPVAFTARLYPANDLAAPYGVVVASVTNDLNGRGHFSTAIAGESFAGEATRSAGSARDGQAAGAGNHGSYITCRYTMNSPSLGSGSCRLSNGAMFSMHVGG
jgi:hypothetical protein